MTPNADGAAQNEVKCIRRGPGRGQMNSTSSDSSAVLRRRLCWCQWPRWPCSIVGVDDRVATLSKACRARHFHCRLFGAEHGHNCHEAPRPPSLPAARTRQDHIFPWWHGTPPKTPWSTAVAARGVPKPPFSLAEPYATYAEGRSRRCPRTPLSPAARHATKNTAQRLRPGACQSHLSLVNAA